MTKVKAITVALLMIFGIGVAMANTIVPPNPKKDPKQAFNYVYNIAVTQNLTEEWATYMLGKYYETGYGTKKNIDKAYVWYSMSTASNYKPAIQALTALKKTMSASEIKKAQKLYVTTRDASIKRGMADIKYSMTH